MGYRLKRFLTGCRRRLRAGARCRGAMGADTAPSGLASWDIAARYLVSQWMREGRLKRVEEIVQRQRSVAAKRGRSPPHLRC